jgi:hypothetical protein
MLVDTDNNQPQRFPSRNFSASVAILSDAIAHADEMRALIGQAKGLLPDHSQRLAAYARACNSLAASLRLMITNGVH